MLLYYPFWMFMGFTLHFYIIFGTNLLTGGPARIIVFCLFWCLEEKEYQTESKRNETFGSESFWNKRNPGDLEWTSRSSRGGHKAGGRAPTLVAPRGSLDLHPSPIYIYVPRKHPGAPRKTISMPGTLVAASVTS